MKSIIVKMIFLILVFAVDMIEVRANIIVDNKDTIPTPNREYYMNRSKSQKTGAIVMVGVGSVAFGIGIWGAIIVWLENGTEFYYQQKHGSPWTYGAVELLEVRSP
ncbi:MAG: hypothetical protein QM802_12305 [Agriterribacter sp.]